MSSPTIGAERQSASNGKPKKPGKPDSAKPWVPFPTDILPEPIGGFVCDGAKAIGCDASYIALPLLAACGAAIGNTRRLLLKRGWVVPPILWAAIVGESGTTKTPAFKLVLKPFRERQQKALQEHARQMQAYQNELARWERENAQWKREKGDGAPPDKPEEPQVWRNVVSDTTVEGLAPLLLANPRGLLLARDELAGWIGSFDRYASGKGGDSAHWLSMYDADSVIIDRKTGIPRTIYVPQAAVSVVGGIQPSILRRALGVQHRESGLAARLLMTCPPRIAKRWRDDDIDPIAEQELAQLVDRLYELKSAVDTGDNQQPVVIGLARDAHRLWQDYYNSHGLEQIDLQGDLAAAYSKLEAIPARLALILHCIQQVAGGREGHRDSVDLPTMSMAIQLAEWFKQEIQRIYGLLDESSEQAETRELLEWIDRKGGVVTTRDLQQGPRRYRRSQEVAEAALQDLVTAGYGQWVNQSITAEGGRPTRSFQSGYGGNGNTTQANPGEIVGSVAVATVASPKNTQPEHSHT